MKHLYRGVICIAVLSIITPSCNKLDKDEALPTYVFIDSVALDTYYIDEGSNSHGITDVWAYLNNGSKISQIGVFELPARIPIIAEGNNELLLYAGIKPDGISAKRKRYSFYKSLSYNLNFEPLKKIYLNQSQTPTFKYYGQNEIGIWFEDFEDPTIFFDTDPISNTSLIRVLANNEPENVFEGNGSGMIQLNSNESFARVYTNENFNLPGIGKSCYVEINYKCNHPFKVGLKVERQSGNTYLGNTGVNASFNDSGIPVWKKMYIDLTDVVSSNPNALSYEFYFEVTNSNGVNIKIYLDNIKLVYAR